MPNYSSLENLKAKLNKVSKDFFLKRTKSLLTVDQLELINQASKIINQCKDGNWITKEYNSLQLDLLTLQSILVNLAIEFGDIMSLQDMDNASISATRAKIRLDAKKAKYELDKEGTPVKCTAEDIKDIAYDNTAEATSEYESHKLVGDHMKFIYYAIRDQAQLMEKAIARIAKREE